MQFHLEKSCFEKYQFFGLCNSNSRWANRPDSHGNSAAHKTDSFVERPVDKLETRKRGTWNLPNLHDRTCHFSSLSSPLSSATLSPLKLFLYTNRKPKQRHEKREFEKTLKHFLLSLVHYRSPNVKQRNSFLWNMETYLSLLVIVSISYVCSLQFEDDASANLEQAK